MDPISTVIVLQRYTVRYCGSKSEASNMDNRFPLSTSTATFYAFTAPFFHSLESLVGRHVVTKFFHRLLTVLRTVAHVTLTIIYRAVYVDQRNGNSIHFFNAQNFEKISFCVRKKGY